jgi:hypothetical protein
MEVFVVFDRNAHWLKNGGSKNVDSWFKNYTPSDHYYLL